MKAIEPKNIALAGVVGALYAVLTISLMPISYGIYQVRIAECLTILPFLFPSTIYGLFVGCLVANIFGGNGLQDIVFGSLLTLIAAYMTFLTSKINSKYISLALAPLPPVLINSFGVSIYLSNIIGVPYFHAVHFIAVGQIVSCYVIGLPLLIYLRESKTISVYGRSVFYNL